MIASLQQEISLRADRARRTIAAEALVTDAVLGEINDEVENQEAGWGMQDHPNGTRDSDHRLGNVTYFRGRCDSAAADGTVTWEHILSEEIAEAYAETDPMLLREELIQVAAVATSWVKAIDRARAAATSARENVILGEE